MTTTQAPAAERAAIRERYLRLSASLICDAFDELGEEVPALHESFRPVNNDQPVLAGWAYTISGNWDEVPGPDRKKLQVVDQVPEDSVTVWSGNGATGICLFGDLIATTMSGRGCRGAVVAAGVRDVAAIGDLGFPVFSQYVSPVQSIGRWVVTSHSHPVYLPGALGKRVRVAPGDFVFGDRDGCVVVPKDLVTSVLDVSERSLEKESQARADGTGGLSALEMLERYGHV